MNVVIYNSIGQIENVYINPHVSFELWFRTQTFSMRVDSYTYPLAEDYTFDISGDFGSFSLTETEHGYVMKPLEKTTFSKKDFRGYQKEKDKK